MPGGDSPPRGGSPSRSGPPPSGRPIACEKLTRNTTSSLGTSKARLQNGEALLSAAGARGAAAPERATTAGLLLLWNGTSAFAINPEDYQLPTRSRQRRQVIRNCRKCRRANRKSIRDVELELTELSSGVEYDYYATHSLDTRDLRWMRSSASHTSEYEIQERHHLRICGVEDLRILRWR